MRGAVLIAPVLFLILLLFLVPTVLAQCTVWTSFEPYDWHEDYAYLGQGEMGTAGIWINGDGYENVTHATFYWRNPFGHTIKEQTVNMTDMPAAKVAYDSFTPYTWEGQWVVRINYYSPDIPGGGAQALPFYFYFGVTPTTVSPTTTIVDVVLTTTTQATTTAVTTVTTATTTAVTTTSTETPTAITTLTPPTTATTTTTPASLMLVVLILLGCALLLTLAKKS